MVEPVEYDEEGIKKFKKEKKNSQKRNDQMKIISDQIEVLK
jgi:hypothetical protein